MQYNTNNRLAPLTAPARPLAVRDRPRARHRRDRGGDVTAPGHPALTTPNEIGAADFDGWVQERGLYFAEKWDGHYETPLAMHDPGEAPLAGSLLWARYGKGTFVYTGLAFFRQLPAGVPGAFRLFANLLAGGASACALSRRRRARRRRTTGDRAPSCDDAPPFLHLARDLLDRARRAGRRDRCSARR